MTNRKYAKNTALCILSMQIIGNNMKNVVPTNSTYLITYIL